MFSKHSSAKYFGLICNSATCLIKYTVKCHILGQFDIGVSSAFQPAKWLIAVISIAKKATVPSSTVLKTMDFEVPSVCILKSVTGLVASGLANFLFLCIWYTTSSCRLPDSEAQTRCPSSMIENPNSFRRGNIVGRLML